MTKIIAEFHYWDYGGYSETAMVSRPEIKMEELDRIGREFNVEINFKKISTSYFAPMSKSWKLPRYGKIIIRVSGEEKGTIKTCIGRIFLRYGKPDEIPSPFFGVKRLGKSIINELLEEFWKGKN